MDPFFQHVLLTVVAVAIGFAIAFTLALVAYRRRWLINPVTQVTGVLYTIPSIAAFFLLLPITGRGFVTATIALVAYVLLIIFRNVLTGLDNVPDETKDAGRGMGLTDRQLLWRVEVPLAMPEIMAGLRIAVTTTVGLATLAFFAGAGGLGEQIFADINFKSNVVVAGGLAVAPRGAARRGHPAHAARDHALDESGGGAMNDFFDAIDFIFNERESPAGGAQVGGLANLWELMWPHLQLSGVSMAIACAIAIPLGLWLGHIGKGGFLAINASNVGPSGADPRADRVLRRIHRRGLLEPHARPGAARDPADPHQRVHGRAAGGPRHGRLRPRHGDDRCADRAPGGAAARAAADLRRHPHLRRERDRDGDHRTARRSRPRSATRSST